MSNPATPNWNTEQATAALKQRLGRQVWDLRVLIHEGHVVLQGFAVTYYAKQLAQHAALEVIGLPIKTNEIEVRVVRPTPAVDEG
jgi:osmotically-inducible protein OsmY